jgi:hypothetical protein
MIRYRLHTLLLLLAIGPPLSAWTWTSRGDLKAMAATGLDTLPYALIVGVMAVSISGLVAALMVEATTAFIDTFRRRS